MTSVVDVASLGRYELVILLSDYGPPIVGKNIPEHQIDLHRGCTQAEGEDVLIRIPLVRRQIGYV